MRPMVWLEDETKEVEWERGKTRLLYHFSCIQVPGDGVNARVHWWHETPQLLANDHTGSILVCRAILVEKFMGLGLAAKTPRVGG